MLSNKLLQLRNVIFNSTYRCLLRTLCVCAKKRARQATTRRGCVRAPKSAHSVMPPCPRSLPIPPLRRGTPHTQRVGLLLATERFGF